MSQELIGDTWFGTDRKLSVGDFKGRYLLLDFWTLCCVNCHHVLAELRPLEEKFSEVLTVVGIHSPKFEHEKDPVAVRAAISRHGIDHLVLNDPNMSTWEAFGVRAWPTLVLID
ncbi:MAG: thioredoxin-like domain-containing protein, partial [Acidimicrobiales bacterium]